MKSSAYEMILQLLPKCTEAERRSICDIATGVNLKVQKAAREAKYLKIIELLNQGLTTAQIGKHFGYSKGGAQYWIQKTLRFQERYRP